MCVWATLVYAKPLSRTNVYYPGDYVTFIFPPTIVVRRKWKNFDWVRWATHPISDFSTFGGLTFTSVLGVSDVTVVGCEINVSASQQEKSMIG